MSMTDTPAPETLPTAPVKTPGPSTLRRVIIAVALFVAISIGIIVLFVALLFAGTTLVRSSDQIDIGADGGAVATTEVDAVAYGYFGELALAQGSSINTTVVGQFIESTADVEVLEAPGNGLSVKIAPGDDGSVRLELALPNDFPVGTHNIMFRVTNEPEPVNWVFTVLPR